MFYLTFIEHELIQRIRFPNQTHMSPRYYSVTFFANNFKDVSTQRKQREVRGMDYRRPSALFTILQMHPDLRSKSSSANPGCNHLFQQGVL